MSLSKKVMNDHHPSPQTHTMKYQLYNALPPESSIIAST